MYNHQSQLLISQHFFHTKKKPHYLFVVTPPLPYSMPKSLATINLLSVSVDLPTLEISYMDLCSNLAVCVWLLSFSIMFSRCTTCFSMYQYFVHFDRYCFIVQTYPFSLSIHQLMDIWVVSTFWLLEIMLLRKFMCKFFGTVFFFWGTAKLFTTWLHHFTILPALYKGANFSTSSPTYFIVFFFY